MNSQVAQCSEPQSRQVAGMNTFIVKIASRCNLNCTYCYMYNLGDDSWKKQPKFMDYDTLSAAATSIRKHCEEGQYSSVFIVLHGGEPLIVGSERLDKYCSILHREFSESSTKLQILAQSNGLLLKDEVCEVLQRHQVRVGISIDGIPGKGDSQRVDHQGKPSGAALHERLVWLNNSVYREIFSGFISVFDPTTDPVETLKYLLQFNPKEIDFRPNMDHYERLPQWYQNGNPPGMYARWLIGAFNYMLAHPCETRIRLFNGLIAGMVGSKVTDLFLGNEEIWAGAIDTDGALNLVDSLRSVGNGVTQTGLNIKTDSLTKYKRYLNQWVADHQFGEVSPICSRCSYFRICRGGFYIHRFNKQNGFKNPSVYCDDLKILIKHMYGAISSQLLSVNDTCSSRGLGA